MHETGKQIQQKQLANFLFLSLPEHRAFVCFDYYYNNLFGAGCSSMFGCVDLSARVVSALTLIASEPKILNNSIFIAAKRFEFLSAILERFASASAEFLSPRLARAVQ